MKRVFEYLQSLTVVVLILAAMLGMSYHVFRDNGWLQLLTGRLWTLEIQYPVIAIPSTIAAIVLFRLWRHHRLARGRHSQMPDILIYVLMAVGLYFFIQYMMHGSL